MLDLSLMTCLCPEDAITYGKACADPVPTRHAFLGIGKGQRNDLDVGLMTPGTDPFGGVVASGSASLRHVGVQVGVKGGYPSGSASLGRRTW